MTAARNIFKAVINHWLIMHIIFFNIYIKIKTGNMQTCPSGQPALV